MNYTFIGWCRDEEKGIDKIWGIIELHAQSYRPWDDHKYITFWGRRGRRLQTKIWTGNWGTADHDIRKKLQRGYRRIDPSQLNLVYPEFQQDLEQTAVWGLMMV